jgi:hypothetical protein
MGATILAQAATGFTVYGGIVDRASGNYWNGASMEAYNQAHWANYVVSMPENAGSGTYVMTVPGGLPNGQYWVLPYLRINPSPTVGVDTPLDVLRLDWLSGNAIYVGSPLNVGFINGSSSAAIALAVAANAYVIGAAAAGTLTTASMTTNLAPSNAVANMYAGRILIFTSGLNAGIAVLLTAFAVTGGKLTFQAYNSGTLPVAPSAGDTFIIL